MGLADGIQRLERVIREARATPVIGGAMLEPLELQDMMDAIRVDLFEAARQLPDGRWVEKGPAAREAIDELSGVVHDARAVPLTGRVRVDRERALALVERMRAGAHQERIVDAPPPDPIDSASLMALLDRLDATLRKAKPVPLTDQARVEKEEVYDVLDRMRGAVPGVARGAPELLVPIDRLDDLIHNAAPVPLTDQVRVDRQEVAEIVQTMRAAFSQGTRAAPTN